MAGGLHGGAARQLVGGAALVDLTTRVLGLPTAGLALSGWRSLLHSCAAQAWTLQRCACLRSR